MKTFAVADLCDEFEDVQVAEPVFKDFGTQRRFWGQISTVKCFEDNSYVKKAVEEDVSGRAEPQVLVVDGGGSVKYSLLGDNLAASAYKNGWTGVIINGAIRDVAEISKIPSLGVRALALIPRKTAKKDVGERDVVVEFAGVTFRPGSYVYVDEDGIIVSEKMLL